MTIQYKYNEGDLLRQVTEYVNATYGQHYSQNKYQATEFIIDGGHGVGFTVGNIMKYAQRYGHKGTPEDWRKDLMKVIHYAIIALYVHDKEYYEEDSITDLIVNNDIFTLKTSLGTGEWNYDKEQKTSLAELGRNVKLEPALATALSTATLGDYRISDDTITIDSDFTFVPDWNENNMVSSLLTTDEIPSITVTGTKTKKKKG